EMFGWEKKRDQPRRKGNKVIGVGIGQGYHSAGSDGFDGLVRITPDGKIHLHSGVGNLGTYSYASTTRSAAEVLKCDWNNCVIHRGTTEAHLPWSSYQAGSNTTFTHQRANYVAATDAVNKIKEIARSEEHTSELQSREKLVCRLLLEKKKPKITKKADLD